MPISFKGDGGNGGEVGTQSGFHLTGRECENIMLVGPVADLRVRVYLSGLYLN